MRLYIAGPMRGHDLYNFPAFFKAAIALRRDGHIVVNPAEIDMAGGFNPALSLEENGFDMGSALKGDFKKILDGEGIVLLPGWEESSGARIECAVTYFAGLKIFETDGRIMWRWWGEPEVRVA